MSSDVINSFTKENLDTYLKELAKEYRKRNGKAMRAEIVLIGGAAVLANYGFRGMTTDVDAVIHASSSMKDAINCIGDRFGLPNGWLNADFMITSSYSPKLDQYSEYYRTYSNVLTIRTITAEYLIAMKLQSGRKYKNDMSDIAGILAEHEKQGIPITMEMIDTAVNNLYGGWGGIPADSVTYIRNAMQHGNFSQIYSEAIAEEQRTRQSLLSFEEDYPGVASAHNLDNIIKNLKAKQNERVSLLEQLQKQKEQGNIMSKSNTSKDFER